MLNRPQHKTLNKSIQSSVENLKTRHRMLTHYNTAECIQLRDRKSFLHLTSKKKTPI